MLLQEAIMLLEDTPMKQNQVGGISLLVMEKQ